MKKLVTLALAICVVALSAMSAFAQPDARDVGVFLDPAGTVASGPQGGFAVFNFYVVGFELDGLVKGFEYSLTVDPAFNILGATFAGPGPLNVGDFTNVIVGTGGCVDGLGAIALATYNGGYFAGPVIPSDFTLCLGAASPSSFNPAGPGYLQCDNSLVPFGVAQNGAPNHPNGCLVLNPTDSGPVATESNSFGEVKARF